MSYYQDYQQQLKEIKMFDPFGTRKKYEKIIAEKDEKIVELKRQVAKLEKYVGDEYKATVADMKKVLGTDDIEIFKQLKLGDKQEIKIEHLRMIVDDNKDKNKTIAKLHNNIEQHKRREKEYVKQLDELKKKDKEIKKAHDELDDVSQNINAYKKRAQDVEEIERKLKKEISDLSVYSKILEQKLEEAGIEITVFGQRVEKPKNMYPVIDEDGNELPKEKIAELTKEGFRHFHGENLDGKLADYYFKVEKGDGKSVQHAALRWMVFEAVWEKSNTATTDPTEGADVSFITSNGKKYALEIETGAQLKKGKGKFEEKIQRLKKDYDDVVIVVTETDKKDSYKEFGLTTIGREEVLKFLDDVLSPG